MRKFLFIALVFLLLSCEDNSLVDNSGSATISQLGVLPVLPSNYQYQVWLQVGGNAVLVGSFTQSSENPVSEKTFENIDTYDLAEANGVAISIENTSGSQSMSDFVLLFGSFEGNYSAQLKMDQYPAIGAISNEIPISAQYILATPTTPSTNDENDGIWFVNNSTGNIEPGLNLNFGLTNGELQYQAWLQFEGTSGNSEYLNMGKFNANNVSDDSNVFTPYQDNIPNFPGEDFIAVPSGMTIDLPEDSFPLEVREKTVIIQPTPIDFNDSEKPFGIPFLSSTINSDAQPNTNYSMEFVNDFAITFTREE